MRYPPCCNKAMLTKEQILDLCLYEFLEKIDHFKIFLRWRVTLSNDVELWGPNYLMDQGFLKNEWLQRNLFKIKQEVLKLNM